MADNANDLTHKVDANEAKVEQQVNDVSLVNSPPPDKKQATQERTNSENLSEVDLKDEDVGTNSADNNISASDAVGKGGAKNDDLGQKEITQLLKSNNGFKNTELQVNNHHTTKEISSEIRNRDIRSNSFANGAKAKDKNYVEKSGLLRHFIAVLALSSIVLANMNRQAFNQALVSMTKTKSNEKPIETTSNASDFNNLTTMESTGLPITTTTSSGEVFSTTQQSQDMSVSTMDYGINNAEPLVIEVDEFEDRFDWTGAQIGTLQAAFSYGYTPFMIPGGRMSELYGAKWVVFLSGFGSALCCMFSPYFADTNYNLLVASRVFMGLCQTGVSPALYALLTRWLPPDESCVYLPMIKVGVMVGFMSGSLISGFFTWRYTFYITGVIGLVWSIIWIFAATSDPQDHKLLTKQELNYIRYQLRKANKSRSSPDDGGDHDDGNDDQAKKRKKSAPWIRILTNPVVLAFMFSKFTVKLSTDAQSMQIPMYLRNVFKVPQELNGMLSATNFAIQGIFTGLVAYTAKEFVVRETFGLDKTGVRRLFQGISNFGMAAAYILVTFNMSSLSVVCCAFMLLSITSMFGAGGEAVTPVDLSTEYSASIMAIANSCANLSGIVLPPLISMMLANQLDSADNWNLAWRVLATIIIIGGFTYSFFVTAEDQDFDNKDRKKTVKDEQNVVIEMKSTKTH